LFVEVALMARTSDVSEGGATTGGVVIPDGMPVLSPGRHRKLRQGACFMEFASYLAGETWSDHPQCTHPLLAFLARGVNDFTSDEERQHLTRLIPSVIGLTGPDPRLDVLIALRSAVTALPVASESRQRALAAGVIACERMLVALDGEPSPKVRELLLAAQDAAPLAWSWAREFSRGVEAKRAMSFTRQGRAIVSTAVIGTAQACTARPDSLLVTMLELAIADTREFLASAPPTVVSGPVRTEASPVAVPSRRRFASALTGR
jgi:hypothetical protein